MKIENGSNLPLPVKPDVTQALATQPPGILDAAIEATRYRPVMSLDDAMKRRNDFRDFVSKILEEGVDYGKVPGSERPSLLQPGAEKLCSFFGLSPQIFTVACVEDWNGLDHNREPFFYYRFKCQLWRAGEFMGEGEGSCNSREAKYRWRWVAKHDLPIGTDPAKCKTRGGRRSEFEFAIERAEPTGRYGKPADYWKQFRDAIDSGTAKSIQKQTSKGKLLPAWEIDSTLYRIPNDSIEDQVNTILQIAQKRAFIRTTRTVTGASEYFTQDLEEIEASSGAAPEAPPAPEECLSSQPPTKDEQRLQASLLFNNICKICDPEHPKDFAALLTAHLEHYLGDDLHKISTEDPYSLLSKLNAVWDRETKEKGAGKRWVEETAAKHQAREPGDEPKPAPKKKQPAKSNGSALGTLYAEVGMRAGPGDGMTVLNRYITEQLHIPVVEMLVLPEKDARYKECLRALSMLKEMPPEEVRKVLLGAVPEPPVGLDVEDADVPF